MYTHTTSEFQKYHRPPVFCSSNPLKILFLLFSFFLSFLSFEIRITNFARFLIRFNGYRIGGEFEQVYTCIPQGEDDILEEVGREVR